MQSRLMLGITAPIIIGSLILIAIGVGAAWSLHFLQVSTSQQLTAQVARLQVAQELVIEIREMRTHLNRFFIQHDRNELRELPIAHREAEQSLDEAERLFDDDPRRQKVATIRASLDQFIRAFHAATDGSAADVAALQGPLTKIKDELINRRALVEASELLAAMQIEVEQTAQRNQGTARRMVWGMVVLGTCGGLAGLLTGYGVARNISRNLVQLSVPIRTAAGKLDEVVGPIRVSSGQSFAEMQGSLERIAAQVADVVERLHRSQQQALRAEQMAAVGQLAAGLAHELRNPLTAMKILVQSAAEREDLLLRNRRDLVVLEEEIGRMEQLINSFLDFARPPQLHKRQLDLAEIVRRSIEVVQPRAARLGVQIESHLPAGPTAVDADAGQLRQLLLNLLLNAIDAAGQGGWVGVELADVAGQSVLSVADNGAGLPADLGETIFQPFVSTKPMGIGLGLSISRRIAQAHGGDIEAANRPEGGARFSVWLPTAPLLAPSG